MGGPRDILAARIATWIEDTDAPYPYADALINALDKAGYLIVSKDSPLFEDDGIDG